MRCRPHIHYKCKTISHYMQPNFSLDTQGTWRETAGWWEREWWMLRYEYVNVGADKAAVLFHCHRIFCMYRIYCVFMSVLYRKCFSFTVWQREVVHHCEFSAVCVLNHAYSADSIIYYLTWCLHDIVCRGIFIGEDISSKVSANIF